MTILDEVGADWDRLAEQSANVFATREWLTLWWERFGEGRRLIVDEVIDEGRVAAILALYAWRERPLRVLRFLGHGAGDELGPICAPADRPAAIGALGRLLERERWDVFVGEQLPGGDHWPDASVLAREGSPVIRAGGWEELLATRSGNFRYQVRSLERDNVVSPGARTLADLGITPETVEAIVPAYLDRHRRGGWFNRNYVAP